MDRHAVVTGGGHGLGESIAETLRKAGCKVTITGRNEAVLEKTAARLDARYRVMDVSDPESVRVGFEAIGQVDILVNNAGSVTTAPFSQLSLDNWEKTISVNLTGPFLCSQAVFAGMLSRRWGRIINIASTGSLAPYRYVAAYVAAKHGVIGLTRALAIESAGRGVTVNAVCPGYSDTEMVRSGLVTIAEKTNRSLDEAKAELVKNNPLGRLIEPEEVAQAVLWICQSSSDAFTGQSLVIAGGEIMH